MLLKTITQRTCFAIATFTIATLSACSSSSPLVLDHDVLIDVAEITQNPESYIGKTVLVRNDVIQTLGERGLILDKDRAFSGDAILVIDMSLIPLKLTTKNTPELLVSGKVGKFTSASFQERYNLSLESNLYNKYENQPVIIADSLISSPDPEDLTQSPEAYYNKPLAIKGELEDLKSYGVFELDEEQAFGGEDLIVVQPRPRIELNEEQTVIVYGTLRPFVAVELEQNYNLGWDLSVQQQLEAEYSQEPVLVADKIIPLNK
ncbi:hypothetical protein Xen7305DRAFT_00036770 [Xenococcus sp. PCC 7305]|uniref:hypothetical protein n=1 Tax=Xenococcus sp. PCC 7305 TaxID=102125 RepID=UPI0002AC9321|nr:hypothetical protein [Xenococcus sp. PCC 7305]ELS03952.1 hypothetical protein Xen7305DRAFT_00036770 [Xenococcus sp. PCC 7305]